MSDLSEVRGTLQRRVEEYARLLLARLAERCRGRSRTYGFEYEWIPRGRMSPADLNGVIDYLTATCGLKEVDGQLVFGDRRIVFEPGGQIEFLSPPMQAGAGPELDSILRWIGEVLEGIAEATGIEYLARGFIPNRASAPLLLRDVRYTAMHERFATSGRLGRQMMKGTAAVHLHAAILSTSELPAMFVLFRRLAEGPLAMSPRRREIWCSTDDCRCGLPAVPDSPEDALDVLRPMVLQAMTAVELRTGRPFVELPCGGFEVFLAHFTTIFTDIRLNLKGATLELRTQDSMPPDRFREAWLLFTSAVDGAFQRS